MSVVRQKVLASHASSSFSLKNKRKKNTVTPVRTVDTAGLSPAQLGAPGSSATPRAASPRCFPRAAPDLTRRRPGPRVALLDVTLDSLAIDPASALELNEVIAVLRTVGLNPTREDVEDGLKKLKLPIRREGAAYTLGDVAHV